MTLPSEVGEIDLRVDAAFGADLAADPLTWPWVDLSDRRLSQTVTIQRGAGDEASTLQPTTTNLVLDNPDGALTPENPTGAHWPNVKRGTPLRLWVAGSDDPPSALYLTGNRANYASTAHHASLNIGGDLGIAWEGDVTWDALQRTLVGKYGIATDDREYLLWVGGLGVLALSWSTDGTSGGATTVFSERYPWAGRMRRAVKATLVPDNGAGGHVVTFWWALTRSGPWYQLGEPIVGVGTTSIHAGTASLDVALGDESASPLPAAGGHLWAEVTDDGTPVASPDFAAQAAGTTSFTDAPGRLWALQGQAELVAAPPARAVLQVDEWAPSWPYGDLSDPDDPQGTPGEARVDVGASGITRRLSQGARPLDSSLRRRILDARNVPFHLAYWPLEDGSEATQASSPLPGVQPFPMPGFSFAADSTLASSLPLPKATNGGGFHAPIPPPAGALTTWVVDAVVNIPTAPSSLFTMLAVASTGTIRQWQIAVSSTSFRVIGVDGDSVALVSTTFGPIADEFYAQPTLIRFQVTENGSDVDWGFTFVPLDGLGLAFGGGDTEPSATIGRPTAVQHLTSSSPPDGYTLGHVVVHTGIGLGWLAGAEDGFNGEAAGERFVRLCQEEGLTYAVIGDPADTEPMGPQRPLGLLELLAECAVADGGRRYELRDRPGLGYRTRASLYDQPVALALDAATNDIDNPFLPTLDDRDLRNDVTAKRPNASSARVADEASVAAEGLYDDTVDVNVETDAQLEQQAAWRVHLGTWPGMRYRELTTELTVAPHLIDTAALLDVGDRAQVEHLPPQHPTDVVDLLVDGASESISPQRWTITETCSPAGPWAVGALDDGAGSAEARLDTDGSELDDPIDETDLVFDVAVVDGPLWTTDAGDFPLDVEFGGEVVTLSSIAGASSPQTFTASARSVNGVRKSHPAGTAVRVAVPLRLPL